MPNREVLRVNGRVSVQLSVLVPVFNEHQTVRSVLRKICAVPFPVPTEVIVVDDGSTDGSAELLRVIGEQENLRVVHHERNMGKGAAIQTALQHARGRIVVIQDADDELEPSDLLPLLEVVRGGASVCYGSRFLDNRIDLRWRPCYWANRLLNGICNLLNGLKLTDMNTCYKMMRADIARQINLTSAGFAMEPEITTKLARLGVEIVERPVRYRPRSRAEGKKIRARAFVQYLLAMVRFRFAAGEPAARPMLNAPAVP